MLNNTNDLIVDNFDSGILIALGNGSGDTVSDYSSGGNTITFGNGADDSVITGFQASNSGDVITFGNGDNDSVTMGSGPFPSPGGYIITLGNGADDSVNTGFGFDSFSTSNIITFGNGNNDSVNALDPSGADIITLGNGAGDFVEHDGLFGGGAIITLGNGAGDTVVDQSGGSDTIQVGRGLGDYVNLGLGVATVTFGGLDAQLSLLNDNGNPSFATPTSPTATFVSTANLDVIKGLVAGDTIVLAAYGGSTNADSLAVSTNLAGVANEALLATGTYNAATETFTQSATGHDLLLTYDTQTVGFDSVVLVGAAHEITGTTIFGGTITLG